ncbi:MULTISPECIES: glycerate kinase [unclassified Roseateles]|uniref:glycerate kinase type-2 family protein n=1 Tax=unclassified Roseateles TaxID=2626991 RepID=UPI0006F1D91D|nr:MULTISPECIES: glycerate kinase [unclassified Roseateles]KQW42744.1 hydroxypyruvate reductase [Pelomonas sp. Root405]KRA69421.1 hydroxypyruvate reductase [Pelomonas sp. Root662]
MTLDPRALLRQLYDVAVASALPGRMLAAQLPPPPKGRTLVLGAGKAGGAMAQALEAAWPADAPLSGLVITRYGHVPPGYKPRRLAVVEAAHPVPDAAGQAATEKLLALTRGLTADDLVICLISGGGSALLSLPAAGLTLADKQAVNRALLNSGAAIGEMNCVRKHLSAIKGGRLAAACAPARVLTLAISDVPGDDPAVIASGPTVADATTCADALAICKRYRLDLPDAARAGLTSGAFETPKPGDPALAGHELVMLSTPQMSLDAAAAFARQQGIAAHILSDEIEGESRVIGGMHAALARAVARRGEPFAKSCVILSGGETTVTVGPAKPGSGMGKGGRATEFLLGCALALQCEPGIYGLAADTDGIDGVGPHAGALLTPTSLARARALGLNPQALLDAHDSASFFAPLGDLLTPGPSFTNVNDFRALLIV